MTRHGQLEVDAFCAACGYNLHGQIVSLDERLGFPVCRCPECGRYHPAGAAVTSNSLWLRRFAAGLLAIWIIVVLVATFLLTLAMGGMQVAGVETFTYFRMIAPDGRPVVQGNLPKGGGFGYMIAGTDIVVPHPKFIQTTQPPPETDPQNIAGTSQLVGLLLLSLFLGFLAATLLVTFLWHWRRRRYLTAIALPIIAAGFVLNAYIRDDQYTNIRTWVINRVLLMFAIQCAGIILGILFGRKISRSLVRMVIPPKPRQMLAFLWLTDGKSPPPISGTKI